MQSVMYRARAWIVVVGLTAAEVTEDAAVDDKQILYIVTAPPLIDD